MIAALITGSLFRSAEARISKTGRAFVSATVRVKDGDESKFIRLVALSENAQAEMKRLQDGDCLSVQGPLTASMYSANDGNAKISLSIVANCVLPLRQPPRERKAAAAAPDTRSRQDRCAGTWASERDGPNDDIGFGGDA